MIRYVLGWKYNFGPLHSVIKSTLALHQCCLAVKFWCRFISHPEIKAVELSFAVQQPSLRLNISHLAYMMWSRISSVPSASLCSPAVASVRVKLKDMKNNSTNIQREPRAQCLCSRSLFSARRKHKFQPPVFFMIWRGFWTFLCCAKMIWYVIRLKLQFNRFSLAVL